MTSEDFKGKLVERAELVAEQEEMEQFIIQMEGEMYRNFPEIFSKIKDNFYQLQELQTILHEEQKSRLHIRSSLNSSFTDLIGGESRWGDEITMMLNSNETNEERELQLINEIEIKETFIDSLISDLRKNLLIPDQKNLLKKYTFMSKRVIEIDRLTIKNIIYVEKVLVLRLRSCLIKARDSKLHIEMLKKENIDNLELEETLVATLGMPKDEEQIKIDTQELLVEKGQLKNDLNTFKQQQEALQKRTKCLEDEKRRLNEQKLMVNIWKEITEKTKILGEFENKIEELQLRKYNLESNVISESYEKSDLLVNHVLNPKQRRGKTQSAGQDLLAEFSANKKNIQNSANRDKEKFFSNNPNPNTNSKYAISNLIYSPNPQQNRYIFFLFLY